MKNSNSSIKMTEIVRADLSQGGPMTGNEWYPIIGDMFDLAFQGLIVDYFMKEFIGLPTMGGCLEKARLVHSKIAPTEIVAGAIRVVSSDNNSMYGHNYNPPFEQHAWLVYNQNPNLIIDFALPGLILRGMHEKDEIGPFLTGREPVILAGECPDWIIYKPKIRIKFKEN